MVATDTFTHAGSGGSTPEQRMAAAGYSFTGTGATGENIWWVSNGGAVGFQDEVASLHASLMGSPGHRANILNGSFREIGVGFETGELFGLDESAVTEKFALSGSSVFLTGVAFDDQDGDVFYDVGEGLGGLTVTAVSSTGTTFTSATMGSGGYGLALAPSSYTVTFSGGGFAATTRQVTVGSSNVKLDLIDPQASWPIDGTAGNDALAGTAVADLLRGFGGHDRIGALGGDDHLEGGIGNDVLNGGTDSTCSKARAVATSSWAPAATTRSPGAPRGTRSCSAATGARTGSPTSRTASTSSNFSPRA